jgi:hypothetical protein
MEESTAPVKRVRGRPFKKGDVPNPMGGSRKNRELEKLLWDKWAPKVDFLLTRLYAEGLRGNVPAAIHFLDRIIGKTKVRPDERPQYPATPASAEEARGAAIALVHAELRSLTAAAQVRTLTADELVALSNFTRTLLVASKDERSVAEAQVEAMSNEELARVAQELASKP